MRYNDLRRTSVVMHIVATSDYQEAQKIMDYDTETQEDYDQLNKPRPIKLILETESQKDRVLSEEQKLKA